MDPLQGPDRPTPVDVARGAVVDAYRVAGLPTAALADLARLATQIAGVPAAAINLMTDGSQHTVASHGTETAICDLRDGMCSAILYHGKPVRVADASTDPRWADNPFVNGERNSFRFYCAHQLLTPTGVVFGTLCVFDHAVRDIDDNTADLLQDLAHRVVDILELRLRTHQLEATVEDLTRARHELEDVNQRLTLFAAQVAHDLKGPLTSLSFALATLEDHRHHPAEEDGWLLERARRSVDRMEGQIGDVLRFATGPSGALRDEVRLQTLLNEVRDDLAHELQGVQVVVEGELPTVSADPTQMRLVLQNLVSNAVRFTRSRPHPKIRVSGGLHEAPDHAPSDPGWWLEIADNGTGIRPEDRERVFHHPVRTPDSDGAGIGLATVKYLVAAHRGTVRADTSPSGGALLRIDVPAGA